MAANSSRVFDPKTRTRPVIFAEPYRAGASFDSALFANFTTASAIESGGVASPSASYPRSAVRPRAARLWLSEVQN